MRNIAIITILALVVIGGAVPFSHASTLNATINPKTNVANVSATSNFVAVLTYQNGSILSQDLSGLNESLIATATINSTYITNLENDLRDAQDSNGSNQNSVNSTPFIHIVNATIKFDYHLVANNTALVVYRNLTLNMTITNILRNVSGHEIISMSWRAFRVQGELMADMNGLLHLRYGDHSVNLSYKGSIDVNDLGDQLGIGDNQMPMDMMGGLFGDFHHFATIDFQEFNVPLSQWHRSFNAANNETIFTYVINKNIWVNETVNSNMLGNITLSYHYDPSSTLVIYGNAVPTSNNTLELVTSSSANQTSSYLVIGVAMVVVVAIIVAGVLAISRRKK